MRKKIIFSGIFFQISFCLVGDHLQNDLDQKLLFFCYKIRHFQKLVHLSKNGLNISFYVRWYALECIKKGPGAILFLFAGSGSLCVANPPGVCYYGSYTSICG